MISKGNFDFKLKDCFMGGIPMKKLTFDLQRFDEPITDFDGLKAAITAAANNAELRLHWPMTLISP